MQVEQPLLEDGPKHAHKSKTPTAGGVAFIVSSVLGAAFVATTMGALSPVALSIYPVLLVGCACASLGLADDLAKVREKSNKGISESLRLKVETLIGLALGIYLAFCTSGGYKIWLPALTAAGGLVMQLYAVPAAVTILLTTFLVVATTNAVNIHDGMDGLAAGTSFLVFCTMTVILCCAGTVQFVGLGLMCLILASSLLGFFCFNRHPAKIFMGDTGSLFIGGVMAAVGSAGGLLVWFIPLTAIYIVEALSVLIQRTVFKLTKPYTPEKPMSKLALIKLKLTKKLPGEGKRVFLIAPIHHHYERYYAERGIKEAQIVAAFWVVQLLICLLVLFVFFAGSTAVIIGSRSGFHR
jgi:phospho-N-acetylmuramoyl-pentapeptide-transferase